MCMNKKIRVLCNDSALKRSGLILEYKREVKLNNMPAPIRCSKRDERRWRHIREQVRSECHELDLE